jgi:hypothetical protein
MLPKRSALRSSRCKASPFQSAVSMLNFYINRAGKCTSDEHDLCPDPPHAALSDVALAHYIP